MASDDYLKAVVAIQNVNDTDELLLLNRILRDQFSHTAGKDAMSYRVGDEVTFKGKRGIVYKGKVTKINRKTVGVLLADGYTNYRVSPSLLEEG